MSEEESAPGIRGSVWRTMLGAARTLARTAKGLAVAGALSLAGVIVAYPDDIPGLPAILGFVAFAAIAAAPLLGLGSTLFRRGGSRDDGVLRRTPRGLVIERADGTVRLLGREFESGLVIPDDGRPTVVLEREGGDELTIRVDDDEAANMLLDMAGVTRDRRRTRLRWGNLLRRLVTGSVAFTATCMCAFVLAFLVGPPFDLGVLALGTVAPFLAATAASSFFAWREIEIGSDAVAFTYQGRRRLIPLREVQRVDVRGDALVFLLDGGPEIRFDTRAGAAEALCRRIIAALDDTGRAHGKHAFFARGERSFAEWTQLMRGLLGRGAGFREVPVDLGDTVRVLEDPEAEPEMRVGAALALAEAGEPELANKIRVVADTCVSPKLRVALAAAAGGEAEEEVVLAAQEELKRERQAG